MSKIAFPRGAGRQLPHRLPRGLSRPEPLPCATFEDVFAAAASGDAKPGHDPLGELDRQPGCGHPPPAADLAADHRRTLHADPLPADGPQRARSWRTSRLPTATSWAGSVPNFLRARGITAKTSSDTAGAARESRRGGGSDAGRDCAAAGGGGLWTPIFSLRTLRMRPIIQRVFVDHEPRCRRRRRRPPTRSWVTAFVFRVRNVPAALYKTMGGFATNGVNVTKLESYQIGGSFNATQFYAELEGSSG